MTWGIRGIAVALAGVLGLLTRTASPDLAGFAAQASVLLHGHLADVYAVPWNQAGPAQLLISAVLAIGAEPGGTASVAMIVLVNGALVLLAMWLCERLGGPDSRRRELVAALLALLWIAAPLPWNGHPAELAVPALWASAIVLQRRGRDLLAALALALGTAIAPWAILGLPCLLAAAPIGRAIRTGLIAAVLGVGCYLPFVLTGHFAMFSVHWETSGSTIAALLGVPSVTWWLRVGQGVVVALGVAAAAWWSRNERLAVAVVPLVAALLRVVTDPVWHPYYWYPVAVASLLLIAMVPASRLLIAGVLGYLALLSESADLTVPGPLICLAVLYPVATARAVRLPRYDLR